MIRTEDAVRMAGRILRRYGTRDPDRLAQEMGIIVMARPFVKQKGAYKVIERNRFIFIKEDLHPVMHDIVLLHEIGHDTLHRDEAVSTGAEKRFISGAWVP